MNALDAALDTLVQSIADRIVASSRQGLPATTDTMRSAIDTVAIPPGLEMLRPYAAREVAAFCGMDRRSIYALPHQVLCPLPGPGRRRYLGINVLMYILGQPPVDTQAWGSALRASFVRQSTDFVVSAARRADAISSPPHEAERPDAEAPPLPARLHRLGERTRVL